MNLSPSWVELLVGHGFEAVHWSTIGAATAPDVGVLTWANEHHFVVITNDLDFSATRTGAAHAIRALVEAIVLEPEGDKLKITLKGDLAGMLSAARDSKRSPDTGDPLVQIKLVAGARNQHYLQLWRPAA